MILTEKSYLVDIYDEIFLNILQRKKIIYDSEC